MKIKRIKINEFKKAIDNLEKKIDSQKVENSNEHRNYECSSDVYLDFIEYIKINYIDSINQLIKDDGVYYGPQVAVDFDNEHHHCNSENGAVKGVLVASIESLQIMKDIINSILDKKQTTISEMLYEFSKKYEEEDNEVEAEAEYETEEDDDEYETEEDDDEYETEEDDDEYETEEDDDEYETEEELNELIEFDNYSEEQNDYLEEDEY